MADPKVTITWTLKDTHRTTFDLGDSKHRRELAYLLGVDDEREDDATALLNAAHQMDRDPDYEVAEKFGEMSTQSTWFDRDPGDCVVITDVST